MRWRCCHLSFTPLPLHSIGHSSAAWPQPHPTPTPRCCARVRSPHLHKVLQSYSEERAQRTSCALDPAPGIPSSSSTKYSTAAVRSDPRSAADGTMLYSGSQFLAPDRGAVASRQMSSSFVSAVTGRLLAVSLVLPDARVTCPRQHAAQSSR